MKPLKMNPESGREPFVRRLLPTDRLGDGYIARNQPSVTTTGCRHNPEEYLRRAGDVRTRNYMEVFFFHNDGIGDTAV